MCTDPDSATATRRTIRIYLGLLVLMALLLGCLHFFYSDVKEVRVRWFHLDKERNLPTWFSGVMFFIFGCSAWAAFYWERRRNASGEACFRLPLLWIVVALVGWLMSLDEMIILHENLYWREIRLASEEAGPALKFLTQWQIAFLLPVFLVIVFFVIFFFNRFSASRGALVSALSGVGCWVAAFLLEAIRSWLKFTGRDYYDAGMIVEEELEMLGAVLLLASVVWYTVDIALDFSEQRRERLRLGARFLSMKVLLGLALTLLIFGAGTALAYGLARKLADENAPTPPLHKRALQEARLKHRD